MPPCIFCELPYDAGSVYSQDCTAPDGKVTVNLKGFRKKRRGLIEVLSLNLPGVTKENHGNLQESRLSGRDSECESRALLRW